MTNGLHLEDPLTFGDLVRAFWPVYGLLSLLLVSAGIAALWDRRRP